MSTFSIELTPEQEARLIAAASTQGVAPETMALQFVIDRLPESIENDRSDPLAEMRADTAQEALICATNEAELVDEGGVLVLARLGVDIDDWDSLIEREREARMNALHTSYDR